jgi:hypothetical protein
MFYLLVCIFLLMGNAMAGEIKSAAFVIIKPNEAITDFFGTETGKALLERSQLPLHHPRTNQLEIKHFPAIQIFFETLFGYKLMKSFEEFIFATEELTPLFSIRQVKKGSPLELNVDLPKIMLRFNKKYVPDHNFKIFNLALQAKEYTK